MSAEGHWPAGIAGMPEPDTLCRLSGRAHCASQLLCESSRRKVQAEWSCQSYEQYTGWLREAGEGLDG